MRINRRSIAVGLTVGLIAGGAGGALAATTAGTSTTGTSATTTWGGTRAWDGTGARDRYGYGYGSGPGWSGYGDASGYGDVGAMTFGRAAVRAAAGYLGLTISKLQSRLRSGNTLADLAMSEHKSVASLESAIIAAISSSVHADTALSASQKGAIIADAKQRIGSIVDNACPIGNGSGFGPYDSPMTPY